jgi:hypothetical protein
LLGGWVGPRRKKSLFDQASSATAKPQRKNGAPSTEQQSTPRQFWQTRFYDFDAWSRQKEREKPDYTHANPSKNKLTDHPRDLAVEQFLV